MLTEPDQELLPIATADPVGLEPASRPGCPGDGVAVFGLDFARIQTPLQFV